MDLESQPWPKEFLIYFASLDCLGCFAGCVLKVDVENASC